MTPGLFYASDFSLMKKEGTKPTSDNVYLSCHTEPTPLDDKLICHVSRTPRCYTTQQIRWKMRCDWLRDVPLNVWASVLLKSSLTFLCMVFMKSGLLPIWWFGHVHTAGQHLEAWQPLQFTFVFLKIHLFSFNCPITSSYLHTCLGFFHTRDSFHCFSSELCWVILMLSQ